MNNIYKVIWSKAKNCYVVASEIARSHTKSASGAEKIGGVARHALLALGAACAIACGGFVNVGASVQSETISPTGTTSNPVLTANNPDDDTQLNKVISAAREDKLVTKDNIAGQLTDYAKASDLSAKADANNVYSKTDAENTFATKTELGSYAKSADADAKYAAKTELDAKADKTALDGKANTDLSNLTADGVNKIKETMSADMEKKANKATTLAGYEITDAYTKEKTDELLNTKANAADVYTRGDINTKLADVYSKTEVDGKITGEENARNIAIQTAINGEAENRKNAIDAAIAEEVADRNQAIKIEVDKEANARDTAIANAKNDLQTKITEEKTARDEADKLLDTRLTTAEGKINTLDASSVKYDNATVKDKITLGLGGAGGTKITNLKDADLSDSSTDAVTGKQLNKTNEDLKTEAQTRNDMDTLLNNRADALEKNTGGITRNDAKDETYIEKNVTVDNQGNVTAKGKLTGDGVDAGDGTITTKGSLNVTDASTLKGDVTMEKTLKVTGDTSLNKTDVGGALNVTGASDLKGDVTLGTPNGTNKVTVNGTANFNAPVNMANGLNVTNGETKLKDTKVTGDLNVTGTITTDTMVFGVKPTNYTEIDQGKVTSKNSYINGAGQSITSSSTFDVEKNEVGFVNNATGEQSYHKQTSDVIMDNVKDRDNSNNRTQTKTETKDIITDEKGNSSTTSQTASENKTYLTDKDRKNTNSTVDTAKGYDKTIKGENGETSTKQDELNITNTAKDGTITNDAKNIVNNAATMDTTVTGKATESYGELETTVTGQATQNFNGGLNTTVNGAENHTVTGTQTNTVGGGQINNITGGQTNNILTGDQKTTVSNGSIINEAENGNISNTAKNVTNVGTELVTNKVGTNEVKVSKDGVDIKADADKTIKESVGADTSRTMTDGRIIDKAGDMTVTTDKTTGTTFENGTPKDTTVINGGTIGTNKVNANETNTKKLTAGVAAGVDGGRLTVDANDGVKGSYKYGDYTSRSYILANTLKSGVDNDKDPTEDGFVGSRTDHYMVRDKAKLDETVKDADGSNVTKKTSTKTYTEIKDTNGNTLSVNQKADGNNYKLEDQDGNTNHVTNSATQSKQTLKDKDGNTLTTNQTATKNNFDLKSADGSKENHTTNTVDESRVAIKGENGKAELSTTDEGTTFKHSAAKEAFREGGATNTTIKGNTITTGKVTMDYADVMKDLGVYGNARVDKDMTVKGNTTLGEAGKDTTLTVNSKATFKEKAIFEQGAEVKNGLTVSSGESTFNDKVTMKNGLDVTGGVASDSFTVKGTDIKIDSSGINAGGTVISNVADGSISEGSKDAVNGGQLYQVKNDLEGKVNKVGANAAAMANLHPMEFDPDSKWNIAAAMGNYGSETATAIGAFYRPNEDVMVNFSTAFGTGENMVGGGVSVRLGKGSNKLSREESNALKAQVNDLTARMDALLSVLNPNMSKDFPDVPENHWAYEAVSRLAGNDIVQGYPDGEFHGDRTMTRYEMAEIIYNALSRGAEAEKELVEEFKPELQAMAASEKATAERAEG